MIHLRTSLVGRRSLMEKIRFLKLFIIRNLKASIHLISLLKHLEKSKIVIEIKLMTDKKINKLIWTKYLVYFLKLSIEKKFKSKELKIWPKTLMAHKVKEFCMLLKIKTFQQI